MLAGPHPHQASALLCCFHAWILNVSSWHSARGLFFLVRGLAACAFFLRSRPAASRFPIWFPFSCSRLLRRVEVPASLPIVFLLGSDCIICPAPGSFHPKVSSQEFFLFLSPDDSPLYFFSRVSRPVVDPGHSLSFVSCLLRLARSFYAALSKGSPQVACIDVPLLDVLRPSGRLPP